jgi:hypothetical protein
LDTDNLPPGIQDLIKHAASQSYEFTKALGNFSIQFLALEEDLDRTIHELLGLQSDTGYAVTSAIFNVSTRLEILQRLATDLPLKKLHRTIILKTVDAAIDLNSYRNWLFHSPWGQSGSVFDRYLGIENFGEPKRFKRRMQKSKKTREWQRKDFTTAEIKEKAEECSRVRLRLAPILQRLQLNRSAKEQREQAD